MSKELPQLYGLVLAGGRSTRMGSDKGLLNYHGVPQKDYLYQLLGEICDKVYLSVREDQQTSNSSDVDVIVDKNEYRGPFNGILSAHDAHPNVAWLVLACDLPLLDLDSLKLLKEQRNPDKLATSFATTESGLPEPLITIWEPEGLKTSIMHLRTTDSTCPRKFLIKSDVQLVFPEKDEVLYNANSLTDYEFAKSKLG
ncbi:NTP transferase domain-containing protein [Flagellimonas myxillae]|uniref:NTP transferase domain-containing protein n=1 Tax=Flagellimonas myxillae TaxID=2942214 RepID=UPI00201F5942|nr:NTP transferase domain-containing protein [Muricauda myxillae]MCL6265936.1 NTP transferase domain-containing protein [Muricauda myxillae]